MKAVKQELKLAFEMLSDAQLLGKTDGRGTITRFARWDEGREKSDYSPAFKIKETDVKKVVEEAKEFVTEIEKLLN